MAVCAGYRPDGTRDRKFKNVKVSTKKELEDLYAQFKFDVRNELLVENAGLTFKNFIEEQWLVDMSTNNLAPKTLSRYKKMLEQRILPALGNIKMSDINRNHLNKLYSGMLSDGSRLDKKSGGLSGRTILHHHRLLSSIFNMAVRWDVVRESPVCKVTPPKVQHSSIEFFDDEQVEQLICVLADLDNDKLKYKTLITLALFTGLRRGELLGIEWDDIDFGLQEITIRRSVQYLPGMGVFTKEPKNKTSFRTISISDSVIAALETYKEFQTNDSTTKANLWIPSNLLFTTWDGRPMHPDTVTRWFGKFIKRNSLKHIPLNGLRHTNASLMLADGVDVKTAATRLGHSTPTMILNNYGHMLRRSDREAANKLEHRIIQNASNNPEEMN
jgi:integrase